MQTKTLIFSVLLTLFLSVGCASVKNNYYKIKKSLLSGKGEVSEEKVKAEKPKNLSFLQVKDSIISKGMQFSSLKSKVNITIETPKINGTFKCTGNLIIQKPNKIRMIGSKLATTVFDMISDGTNYWFHLPKERVVYAGKCNAKRTPNNNVYMYPDDIAVLLNYNKLFEGRTAYMDTLPAYWLVHIFEKKNEVQIPHSRLRVDRIDGKVTELLLLKADYHVEARALFDNYTIIDEHSIPQTVQINWPDTRTTITLKLNNVSINTILNPKIFQFKKPRKANIVRIN